MHIRCGSCHGAVWVELAKASARVLRITCPTCAKDYRIEVERDADKAGELLATEARQLVRETQIDLPSAYSVLLGVISFEEVLELGDASSPPCPTTPEGAAHSKALSYDPDFRTAVEEGLLTPMQAMQRGLRHKYVALVARRHRLPEELAIQVTDNRISLLEALRRRGPDAGPPVELIVASAPSRKWGAWVTAAVVGVVVVFAFLHSRTPQGPATNGVARLSSVLGADVLSDEWGRALKVSAADPKSVLAAYCAADADRRFEPIDVVLSGHEGPGERLGLLRRSGRSGELLSIVVREDRAANRWVAGDGTTPLVPHTAPADAARAIQRR